jgi:hypothetical protein
MNEATQHDSFLLQVWISEKNLRDEINDGDGCLMGAAGK